MLGWVVWRCDLCARLRGQCASWLVKRLYNLAMSVSWSCKSETRCAHRRRGGDWVGVGGGQGVEGSDLITAVRTTA